MNHKLILIVFILISVLSCRKVELNENKRETKIGGCNDVDSPFYSENIAYDDQSCTYAFTERYEITYHPEKDGGSDWDPFVFKAADLVFRIKEQGSADWLFESTTKEDQTHNVPAIWAAPEAVKLLNKNYEWELYDEDNGTADDFVASGVFNPIGKSREGNQDDKQIEITDDTGGTQLILYYTVKQEI